MSHRISIISNQLDNLQMNYAEQDKLSGILNPSIQERNRLAFLLSEASMLRQGVTPREIAMAQLAKLKREIGIREEDNLDSLQIENPARFSEWRNLLSNGPNGKGEFRPDPEFRDTNSGNAAGTQSITATEGGSGGYLVPQSYDARLFQSLAQYDEILDADNSNPLDTLTGRPCTTPAIDDVAGSPAAMNKAYILSENTAGTETPMVAGKVSWQEAPKFHSGIIRVSREMFEDSFEGVAKILEKVFAQRFALATGYYSIQGNGNGQPQGLIPALPASTVVTSASSTLAIADFEAVYRQLPNVYRKNSRWYMSDATRDVVTKLLEASGRPMIGPAESLLGKKIAICESMASPTAGTAAVAVLANPDYLLARRVMGSTIQTYGQRYVEYGQVGLQAFLRFDFQPMLFASVFPPAASLNVHA